MKKIIPSLKDFIFSARHFLITGLIVIFLLIPYGLLSDETTNSSKGFVDSLFNDSLFNFSLTDLTLVCLAIYAVLKKPWRENLSEHFKKAYRAQVKSIQKTVKEREVLREECNTFSVHQMSFDSLESMDAAMREQDGYPSVSDLGKQLWDGNKESLLKGLEEIENIKNSKDAEKILSKYSQMEYISQDLFQEVMRLRELKSLSKTGKIKGTVMFTEEFIEDFPKQPRFQISVRFKPGYIKNGYVSQFWLDRNPFYPNDPDTGRRAKKRDLSTDDNWWLLSMNSPYWKYVEFVDFNFENYTVIHQDGRQVSMPPKDYQLADGTKLSDWKNRMFRPLKFEKDGEH